MKNYAVGLMAANARGLAMGWNSDSSADNKSIIKKQKTMKIQKADKSSSAGTTAEQSTNAQVQHVSQPNAKPNVRRIPIQSHFAGDYRIEYDGKYITLYGKDNRYDYEGMFGAPKGTYDEMVLIPVVEEVRNANPEIIEVTETEIVVSLGCA